MAITGYLEEIIRNNEFNARIKSGLEYLNGLSGIHFKNISAGDKRKEKIKGSKVFAVNQVYKTKSHSEEKFEGHRAYIDLQYIFEGEELIKIASIKDCLGISEYSREKDVRFFSAGFYSTLLMKKGMIAVFYPEDIHAPSLRNKEESIVKKSVVKIKIQNP